MQHESTSLLLYVFVSDKGVSLTFRTQEYRSSNAMTMPIKAAIKKSNFTYESAVSKWCLFALPHELMYVIKRLFSLIINMYSRQPVRSVEFILLDAKQNDIEDLFLKKNFQGPNTDGRYRWYYPQGSDPVLYIDINHIEWGKNSRR